MRRRRMARVENPHRTPKAAASASDREALAGTLRRLFRSANDEVFEDGMGGDFSNSLSLVILDHGVAAVGAGSKLITKELVAAKDWDGLAAKVRQSVDWIREIRAEMAG